MSLSLWSRRTSFRENPSLSMPRIDFSTSSNLIGAVSPILPSQLSRLTFAAAAAPAADSGSQAIVCKSTVNGPTAKQNWLAWLSYGLRAIQISPTFQAQPVERHNSPPPIVASAPLPTAHLKALIMSLWVDKEKTLPHLRERKTCKTQLHTKLAQMQI